MIIGDSCMTIGDPCMVAAESPPCTLAVRHVAMNAASAAKQTRGFRFLGKKTV
jgi:hypothetical protein